MADNERALPYWQIEAIVAAILTAGKTGAEGAAPATMVKDFKKVLEELRKSGFPD